MTAHIVTHRFLRVRLLLALGLVLAASVFGWSIDRAKHDFMIEKSALAETFNDALQATTAVIVTLQSVEDATSAGIATSHKERLLEPAAELQAVIDRIERGVAEGRLADETRSILESDILDPLGLIDDLAYIARSVATQPDLWGERSRRHLVTANSIASQLLPVASRISAVEQADLEADLVSYARWRVIALCLVAGLLVVIWAVIFRPLERGIMSAQDELAGQIERAEAASRAKSEFLATISHELRTPMHGVLGMAEELSLTSIGDGQREMVRELEASGQALLTIIDDVLDISRIEAGKLKVDPRPTDIRAILRSLEKLFAHQAEERGISFAVRGDGRLAARHLTDGGRLRQILTNLVGNAIKFTPAGAVTVRVTAEPEDDGRQLVRFAVRDTGIGLEPRDLERVFEPFEQADASTTRRFGGTGLGLAISRRIAQALGGDISVNSDIGRGSTFTVALHLEVVTEPQLDGAVEEAEAVVNVAGTRVLIVEDNRVNSLILCRILERAGCATTVVESGEDAVRRARAATFDIAFMDISMPGMDGFETTRRIRGDEAASGRPVLPFVALTAHVGDTHRSKCLDVGMQAVMGKPFRRAEVIGAIAGLIPSPQPQLATGETAT